MRILAGLLVAAFCLTSLAADIPGAQDHPMISRYEGAEIMKYDQKAFDEVALVKAPIQQRGGRPKNPDAFIDVEGKVTRLAYRIPEGRSTLEVYRNYEQALTEAGFEPIFACSNADCGGKPAGRPFNETVTPPDMSVRMGFHEKDQRYLLTKLNRAEGNVYTALYMVRAYGIGGPDKDRVFVNVQVVEAEAMQTGMVTVDAEAMAKGLEAEGHIALYEIYFDTNKAELKAESATALTEITKLLLGQPKLVLLVVGHTDNQGDLAYNQQLSSQRANAVVAALVKNPQIGSERLIPVGVGMAAPVASNASEAGRAKNRRVELVVR